ncbi:MAG: hypothetical protein IPH44_41200 [Myxococcales bacterium]|nr:hypothetical protein [Myxococcales bacterium]
MIGAPVRARAAAAWLDGARTLGIGTALAAVLIGGLALLVRGGPGRERRLRSAPGVRRKCLAVAPRAGPRAHR